MADFKDGAAVRLKTSEFASHVAMVTPEIAAKWLTTQIRNRPVQRSSMRSYRADMVAGRWHFAGDPIRFDSGGHLIDGQNRLTALSEIEMPNMALPFVVQTGLPPETQMVMDQGARRTAGQNLALEGIPSGYNLSAGYRLMAFWQNGMLFDNARSNRQAISNTRVQEWVGENLDVCMKAVANLNRIRKSGIRPSAGMAVTLYITGKGFDSEISSLLEEVHTLSNLPPGAPALTLARRLRNARHSDRTRSLTEPDHLAFLIQTWNSWVAGTPRHNLMRPSGGWNSDNFPELDL